ncbi:MAG: hypothetical protein ACO1SX_00205 [Actinomycetota bacterium]
MGKRGPQPDPNTEPKVIKSFSFRASAWERIEKHTRKGERSKIVQEALLQAAKAREADS